MKVPKIGVIGLGVIGQMHLRMAQRMVEAGSFAGRIEAVCDIVPGLADKTADTYDISQHTTNVDEVLANPEVDGIVLAMPAHLRTPIALRAFAAGKHVLTEKPVAMNASEVRQMILARDAANATRGQNKLIGASCSCRYLGLPSTSVVRKVVESGALGEIRVARVRAVLAAPGKPPFDPPPIWRLRSDLNGGGILMNWGHYDADYMFSILGYRLKPVQALARTFANTRHYPTYVHPSSDAETHIVAFVDCIDTNTGKPCAFTYERAEFTTSATDEVWQVIGSEATLRLFMKEKTGKQLWIDKPTPDGTKTELLWEGDEDFTQQHDMPIRDFAEAMRDGRAPATPLEHALVIQSMFDAMYASAKAGATAQVT